MSVIGVVLAGGRARRLGGEKATLPLGGRPMIEWPLRALRAGGLRAVVVAKSDSSIPAGVEVWREPDEPRHPRVGLVEALRRADGAAILVCAVDMPFVEGRDVRALLHAPAELAALAQDRAGRMQPLLGRYEAAALAELERAAVDEALTDTVLRLAPTRVALSGRALVNVNAPEDLAAARAQPPIADIVRDGATKPGSPT